MVEVEVATVAAVVAVAAARMTSDERERAETKRRLVRDHGKIFVVVRCLTATKPNCPRSQRASSTAPVRIH